MSTMTRSKWFLISFAILLVANVVLLFMVFNRPSAQSADKRLSPSGQMIRDLALDSTQQILFKQQKDSFFKDMKPLWEDIRMSKFELYRLVGDTTASDSTIERLAYVIGVKTSISEAKQFKHFRHLRMLCTPEQQVRFDTLIPQLMSKYGSKARQKGQ
jgi:hypothetical protein